MERNESSTEVFLWHQDILLCHNPLTFIVVQKKVWGENIYSRSGGKREEPIHWLWRRAWVHASGRGCTQPDLSWFKIIFWVDTDCGGDLLMSRRRVQDKLAEISAGPFESVENKGWFDNVRWKAVLLNMRGEFSYYALHCWRKTNLNTLVYTFRDGSQGHL